MNYCISFCKGTILKIAVCMYNQLNITRVIRFSNALLLERLSDLLVDRQLKHKLQSHDVSMPIAVQFIVV